MCFWTFGHLGVPLAGKNFLIYRNFIEKQGKFVIVSFSIDNKEQDWKRAIKKFNINKKGWIHGSDLLGWSSPSTVMLGVSAVPKMLFHLLLGANSS